MLEWPEFPVVKQKLLDEQRFTRNWNNEGVGLSTRGAHMPIMIFTCGESWRSKEAEIQRGIKSKKRSRKGKSQGSSKHSTSQDPQDEILGFDAVAAESSGSAAVAAEPGPAWDAWTPGPAAFAPEVTLDQWRLSANLLIGPATLVQPDGTEQQRMESAIHQHYAMMAEFAAYYWRRCAIALGGVSWLRLPASQPLYLPISGLDASQPEERNYDAI